MNPLAWLTNKHSATIFAILIAGALAALPAPGREWSWQSAGTGGLILWPMFGATNQLLGGLAFLVIGFCITFLADTVYGAYVGIKCGRWR